MAAQQPLPSTAQPTDIYGGDEVAALILDPGYSTTRAGFAGEEFPKSVVPSYYIVGRDGARSNTYGDDSFVPRPGLEIRNYMSRDSVVEDWEAAAGLWKHMLVEELRPDAANANRRSVRGPSIAKTGGDATATKGGVDDDGDVAMDEDRAAGGTNGDAAEGGGATENGAAGADGDGNNNDDEDYSALSENPLLLTEAAWNTAKAREKAAELAFESFGVPAFWLSRTPVLAAFAAGKPTALVVDVGHANVSVAAVHDGMLLKRSVQRSPAAGLWLSSQVRSSWAASDPPLEPLPRMWIGGKKAVEPGQPAEATYRSFDFPVQDLVRAYHEEALLQEYKEDIVEVWHGQGRLLAPGNEEHARATPGRLFELADGYSQTFRVERVRAAEGLFDEAAALPPPAAGGLPEFNISLTKAQTIPELVRASLMGVDVDLRPHLLANVVVTGGTSLVHGFTDRLNIELQAMFTGVRVKLHAAGLASERRFGPWVGGSILASLGTFHQLWISRKEYEENGAGIVEKRCK